MITCIKCNYFKYRIETDSGFLAFASEAKGIIGLSKGEDTEQEEKITPFPPGHVASYSLDERGKVSFIGDKKFHSPGEPPKYVTNITDLGMFLYFVVIELVINVNACKYMNTEPIKCVNDCI